ncbi:18210_t:CDS:2, partial [Funneliformis geosporum]
VKKKCSQDAAKFENYWHGIIQEHKRLELSIYEAEKDHIYFVLAELMGAKIGWGNTNNRQSRGNEIEVKWNPIRCKNKLQSHL